jgi:hypothetical protein
MAFCFAPTTSVEGRSTLERIAFPDSIRRMAVTAFFTPDAMPGARSSKA